MLEDVEAHIRDALEVADGVPAVSVDRVLEQMGPPAAYASVVECSDSLRVQARSRCYPVLKSLVVVSVAVVAFLAGVWLLTGTRDQLPDLDAALALLGEELAAIERDAAIVRREIIPACEAEMTRVLHRLRTGHAYADKISLDRVYERLRDRGPVLQEEADRWTVQAEQYLKAHEDQPDYVWRIHHLLATIHADQGHLDQAGEHLDTAISAYPTRSYPHPSKHSKFQHLINQRADLIWQQQGPEAAEQYALQAFRTDPRFVYFFLPWWEKQYEEHGVPERLMLLRRAVLAVSGRKAATSGTRARAQAETSAARIEISAQELPLEPPATYMLLNPAGLPEEGVGLVVVLPGGSGDGTKVVPFWERVAVKSLNGRYAVALACAPRWASDQQIVWPTVAHRRMYPTMRYTTEELAAAIVADIRGKLNIREDHVFLHGISSGGPPTYAASLTPKMPFKGYYIVASVYKPDQLPPLAAASGKAYHIHHSRTDRICPYRMAQQAEAALSRAGASVKLATYKGEHGYPFGPGADGYRLMADAFRWLEGQVKTGAR